MPRSVSTRHRLAAWCLTAGLTAALATGCAPADTPPPNIVLILAADMGYGDIHAYNPASRIPTPHLDALAEQGSRFTDAHSASAVCSPSRYALLTGRYSWRTWLTSNVLWPPDDRPMIEPERLTLASMLKQRGYDTAVVGKWHLGIEWGRDDAGAVDYNRPLVYGPTDVGFDTFFGIAGSLDMVPYAFYHDRHPVGDVNQTQPALDFPRFVREGPRSDDFDPGTVLDRLATRAADYIETQADRGAPFFLYVPLTAPHKPVWPADRFVGTTDLGPYGDFVAHTDAAVGEILDALDRSGIADETLVIFSSDNGSFMYRRDAGAEDHTDNPTIQAYADDAHRANADWRGTKADIWEAGHRVPFIVRWPGVVAAGTASDHTVSLVDVLATAAAIVEHPLKPDEGEDSVNLLPVLRGEVTAPRPPMVLHSFNGTFALRDGDWKLVFSDGSGGREVPIGTPFGEPYRLFDLRQDPAERTDLAATHPEVVTAMTERLDAIRSRTP